MTQPSKVLDAMVARIRAALEPTSDQLAHGTPRVHVGVIDDAGLADVTEYHTVPVPSVLISCTALPAVPVDYGPMVAEGQFIARCFARSGAHAAGLVRSRGDVAMDLAALVSSLVDEEVWPDAEGRPTALSRATRVGARNLGARELSGRGLSLWLVSWNQRVELTPLDREGVLRALRRIHLDVDIPGGTSPDAEGDLELEGREP